MAIDLKKPRLYSICGNKKMIVMDANAGKMIADVPIGSGTDAAAFDPEKGLAFSSYGDDTLTVVRESAPSRFSAKTVRTQPCARTMTLDPKTHRLYLSTVEYGAPASANQRRLPCPVRLQCWCWNDEALRFLSVRIEFDSAVVIRFGLFPLLALRQINGVITGSFQCESMPMTVDSALPSDDLLFHS